MDPKLPLLRSVVIVEIAVNIGVRLDDTPASISLLVSTLAAVLFEVASRLKLAVNGVKGSIGMGIRGGGVDD